MPHRRLARQLNTLTWLRGELATVVCFHLGIGLIIALAPEQFVITPATWSIFFYLGRTGMAAAFLITAALALACWVRPYSYLQLATWIAVYGLGAGWLAGFALAAHRGTGGLYGIVVWATLLAVWASTAFRLGLKDGGTGVEPSRSRRAGQ